MVVCYLVPLPAGQWRFSPLFPLFPFSFFFPVFRSLPPSAVSLPPRVCECVCCFAKFTPFAGSPLNCVIPRCGLESGWGSRINILDLTRRQAINALRGSSQTPTKISTLQSYTTSMREKNLHAEQGSREVFSESLPDPPHLEYCSAVIPRTNLARSFLGGFINSLFFFVFFWLHLTSEFR